MSVSQPFTPHSFNFTKIRKEEILFELVRNCDTNGHLMNGCGQESVPVNDKITDSEESCENQVRFYIDQTFNTSE